MEQGVYSELKYEGKYFMRLMDALVKEEKKQEKAVEIADNMQKDNENGQNNAQNVSNWENTVQSNSVEDALARATTDKTSKGKTILGKINEFAKSSLFVFNSRDIDINYAIDMRNKNPNLNLIDTAYIMKDITYYSIEELWLNPLNYLMMAKNTKQSLNEYIEDPYLNKQINEKYELLQYELSKLDATYKETLTNAKYTTIVTDNELFKFLEKYNIEVISLEEDIKTITIKEGDNLSDISKQYNVSISDILTYNNKLKETLNIGETIKIPIKTIEASNVNKVKKLISENQIKYIFSDSTESNNTVNNLIKESNLELITINTMYSIDGNINNTNDNYLTIMNDNLELLKKELNK